MDLSTIDIVFIVAIIFMSYMGYFMYKTNQADNEYSRRCEEESKRRKQETEELLKSLREAFAKSAAKQKEQERIKKEQEDAKMQYYKDITEIKEMLKSKTGDITYNETEKSDLADFERLATRGSDFTIAEFEADHTQRVPRPIQIDGWITTEISRSDKYGLYIKAEPVSGSFGKILDKESIVSFKFLNDVPGFEGVKAKANWDLDGMYVKFEGIAEIKFRYWDENEKPTTIKRYISWVERM